MRKKFRIKKRPSKPVRKKNQEHEASISYESLQSAVDQAKVWGAPLVECQIEIDGGYGGYYDDCSVRLRWSGPEPDAIFQMRLVDYGRKLKLYEEWAVEFAVEIADELALREVEDEEKRLLAVVKERKRIEAEMVKLQRLLALQEKL